jgi:RHS repeat-associated protein
MLPQQQNTATQYTYNAVGSRSSVTLPNGVFTEYDYSELNALTGMVHWKDNTQPAGGQIYVGAYAYGHYASGMRAVLDEEVDQAYHSTYTYDSLNRLTEETNYNNSAYGYTATYTYDLTGNRLQRTVIVNNASGQSLLNTCYTYYPNSDRLYTETNTSGTSCAVLPWGDKRTVYAFTGPDGGVTYKINGRGKPLSQFTVMLIGLPSSWDRLLLIAILILVPITFSWPLLVMFWYQIRRHGPPDRTALKLWQRCTCILLAYTFLIGPECLDTLSYAAASYDQLSTETWGRDNTVITYEYDKNGSTIRKTTQENLTVTEDVEYIYSLQGRLSQVRTDKQTYVEVTKYTYNPSGIRVSSHTFTEISGIPQNDDKTTLYVIDPDNHTGYAQVLEEWTYDLANPVFGTDTPSAVRYYTLGDDIIAQTNSTALSNPQYLLYDGHGSTRQLLSHNYTVDENGKPVVIDNYNYDGYGVMLSNSSGAQAASSADTKYLYSGEQYDSMLDQYYLRARYYNPANGLFNRMDDYAGNLQDPQSLHKYAYCNNNPINATDSSGNLSLTEIVTVAAINSYMTALVVNPVKTIKFTCQALVFLKDILGHLFSVKTWLDAVGTIWNDLAEIIRDPGQLIQKLLFSILTKLCFVFSIISTIWQAVKTIGMIRQIINLNIPVKTLSYMLAVMIATFVITVGITYIVGKIIKAGTQAIKNKWEKSSFGGKRVYKRDDLVDLKLTDDKGLTNMDRMKRGRAPIGPDGEPICLHHTIQTDDSPVAEVTKTFHDRYRGVLHIDLASESQINRPAFKKWRENYWMDRVNDFLPGE